VAPSDLDLAGIYITEQDTTTSPHTDPGAFACTWMPRGCIDELFEPCSMFVRTGELVELDHRPVDALYRARCGDRLIEGLAVPHDELVTLGHRYGNVELAFLYAMPPATVAFLEQHRREDPESFREQRLYPPHVEALRGRDRVGVLLASRKHGEYWLGFDNDCRDAAALGTNATELQVAAGVVAGWEQLGRVEGIHGVEDLDAGHMLETAQRVLGPLVDHHDPHATWTPLPDRRV
jgi:homospermidine synthase